jgi:NitT/TauT family transport system permease protein
MTRKVILGVVGVLAVLGATELALVAAGVSSAVFPAPATILTAAASMATAGAFWSAAAQTMSAWLQAMLFSVVIGVALGAVLGLLPAVEVAVRPVLEFLRPIPSVLLFPLLLLIVPDSGQAEVIVVVLAAVWPVLINTGYGFREVDPAAKETLRAFGFGPARIAWHVSLPSAAPFIATGVRIAASLAFVVAIATELIGVGLGGLGGYATQEQGAGAALQELIAIAIWCGILGLALNAAFVAAERRSFRWHQALHGHGSFQGGRALSGTAAPARPAAPSAAPAGGPA